MTSSLARVLGLADLSVLSSASMAPAYSIASTFGLMVAVSGAGAPLALVILTIPILFISLAFHKLCVEYPNAGSSYAWSRLAFGRWFGAFGAWIVLASYFTAGVAAVVPAAIYTIQLAEAWRIAPTGLHANAGAVAIVGSLWVAIAGVLLILGVRPTARASAIFLSIEFVVLLAFCGIAFASPNLGPPPQALLTLGNGGVAGFLDAMVLAIWVTDGWEVSTYTSEENSGSRREPGMGGLIALVVTVALVAVCMVAYLRVGTLQGFSDHADSALAYVAAQLGGGWRSLLMIVVVLVSSAATLWTGQLGISRGLFSMSRDGLFARALTRVHKSFHTPHVSIIAVSVAVIIVTLLTAVLPSAKQALSEAINASSVLLGLTFVLTGAACVVYFVRQGVAWFDLGRVVLPALGTLGVLALLVVNFQSQSVIDRWVAIAAVVLGVAFAAWRGRAVPHEELLTAV